MTRKTKDSGAVLSEFEMASDAHVASSGVWSMDNVRVASGRVMHSDVICFEIEFKIIKMTARLPRGFTLQGQSFFS